ncbi:hypothetical protein Dimus_014933 [Dionaea muscipula]
MERITVSIILIHVYAPNVSWSAKEVATKYQLNMLQQVEINIIRISERCSYFKFDFILLEMGAHGHLASLFPFHAALDVMGDFRDTL